MKIFVVIYAPSQLEEPEPHRAFVKERHAMLYCKRMNKKGKYNGEDEGYYLREIELEGLEGM